MSGFVKLQSSILQSTIWREENHVRILWITMLTLSDSDGVVEGSIPGLADIARISIPECEDGLKRLMSPDPYSRTKEYEGKRIGEIDGGWVVLNYEKYRAPTSRDRTRNWREKNKEKENLQSNCGNVTSHSVTECHESSPASPSVSVSGSVSSFSLSSDLENNKTKVVKDKDNVKDLASKYLDIFNAVFERKTGSVSIIQNKIKIRLSQGVPSWQILCVPVIAKALDKNVGKLQNFDASVLLRDGRHPRTTSTGATMGATDWIEKTYLQADKARLTPVLIQIADKFGLLEDIKRTGADCDAD